VQKRCTLKAFFAFYARKLTSYSQVRQTLLHSNSSRPWARTWKSSTCQKYSNRPSKETSTQDAL